jgi:hypothetical protein
VIVGSIVGVIAAAVLLVLGVVQLNDTPFYSSIVTSAVAALALIVGVRQFPDGRLPDADFDAPGSPGPGRRLRPVGRAGVPRQSRVQSGPGSGLDGGHAHLSELDRAQLAQADVTVPADEPSEQIVSGEAAARVARLRAEVVVVDDRPRYHVSECLHLLGRQGQPLSVREATRLGFTPCSLCEPVTVLLANG